MDQLSGLDGLFINMEMHGNPMHIASFSIYQPSLNMRKNSNNRACNFQNIHNIFDNSLLEQVPILRSRLLKIPFNLDQPYWIEAEDFDLNYHLRHIALPEPGDWGALMQLLSDLHALPLSRAKPLWEAYVIDGLDKISDMPKGTFGLYIKSHHALMDGRTGLQVFTSLHALGPDSETIAIAQKDEYGKVCQHNDQQNRFKRPSPLQLVSRAYINNIRRSWGMSKILVSTLPRTLSKIKHVKKNQLINTAETSQSAPKKHTPRTRFNTACEPGRVVDRIRVPLAQIQALRKASSGSTVNDVAMTIIAGAMRRYLSSKQEYPEHSIVATVPIDVRSKADSDIKGNMLSIMNVAIHSDIANPLQRLKAIAQESASAKELNKLLGKATILNTLQNVHSAMGAWGLKKAITSDFFDQFEPLNNTVITNVPGVPVPIYLAGAKMIESFGIGPLMPKTGTFHTISSCCEWLSICFTSCKDMMPDPAFYRQCLQDEFVAFKEAAQQYGIEIEPFANKKKKSKRHHAKKPAQSTPKEVMQASAMEKQNTQAQQH